MGMLFGEFVGGRGALGLLVIRIVFGLGIMQHGWGKIQHPFNWMGENAGMPGFLQFLAALSEFGGGIALVLGLLTPIAMLGLGITMAFAAFAVHMKNGDPWIATRAQPSSYELAAAYLAVAIGILITGPGKLSLDAKIFGRRS